MELSPHVLTPVELLRGIRSLFGHLRQSPKKAHSVLYLHAGNYEASPKTISERTSYYRARLAFHFYPQVIRGHYTTHQFGPPFRFRGTSSCPWVARSGFGSYPCYELTSKSCTPRRSGTHNFLKISNALFRLGFPTSPSCYRLR